MNRDTHASYIHVTVQCSAHVKKLPIFPPRATSQPPHTLKRPMRCATAQLVVARQGGAPSSSGRGRKTNQRPGRGRQPAPDWAKPPPRERERTASRGARTGGGSPAAGAERARKAPRARDDDDVTVPKAFKALDAERARELTRSFVDASVGTDVFDGERVVTPQECLHYERNGHVCIRKAIDDAFACNPMVRALTTEIMSRRLEAYQHRVAVLCPGVNARDIQSVDDAKSALKKHSQEDVGFLQTFNLHRDVESDARKYILSKRFAKIAADLLGCEKVRLYQSCVFVKEPGMDQTNWHSDLNMVPLDTNDFITLWIPLRSLDEDDAALHFASKSHRDFALPYWRTLAGMEDDLESRYEIDTYEELDLGDLTAHHGFTLHWSPPQPEDSVPRFALSICYFADGAKRMDAKHLRRSPHEEDLWSYESWLKDIKPGAVARHPELPLVWP